jgi:preprotein translocase SecE subunit
MASVTKSNDGKPTKDEADEGGDEETSSLPAKSSKSTESKPVVVKPAGGYFTIYKKGQGYWTRMGTFLAVAVLGILLAYTLYDRIPAFIDTSVPSQVDPAQSPEQQSAAKQRMSDVRAAKEQRAKQIALGIAIGFLVADSIITLRLMNKTATVDFLIATDSEMKKVNWTSRRELIGSTKVVVVFMFLIAGILFLVDQIFHLLFWGVGVLRTAPFWWPS